jgi:EAL domain-containing protein (putative c-di-GMP-specific phosphodiesterase class I)
MDDMLRGKRMATIRRSLFAGEVLYRQGDPADCAWLIETGQVSLVSSDGQRHHDLGSFGPGEMLDELSMLDHGARTATATAATDAVLLAIEDEALRERIGGCDPIVRAMVEGLARRMRRIQSGGERASMHAIEDLPGEDHEQRAGIDKLRREAQLRQALDDGGIEVRYQPIHDIAAGRVTGYEALVRWELPGHGMVSPAEFIQLAEETSLIVPVGEYVLDRVVALLAALRDRGGDPLPEIAVNLSARQLVEPGMARQIVDRVQRADLPAGALKLEVTESRMLDYEPVAAVMRHCREHGIRFALDDFGTGYSNLTHLYKLDFEYVKMDQAFARHMFDSPKAMAIVEAIVAMAHGIGADIICEGVETQAQLQRLRELRVRYAQGYLIGKAAPEGEVLSGEAARGFAG